MAYATLMVALDLGPEAVARVKLAAELAERFGARLIGAAARQPNYAVAGDPSAIGALVAADQESATEELAEVEALFREAVGSANRTAFRSAMESPGLFLAHQARAADLIVIGRQGRDDPSDWRFSADPGSLALESGRPLLVVPPRIAHLPGKRVAVAWKDTREARRVIWDALPLLKRAEEVLVVSVGENARRAGALDVADYLEQHGVTAKPLLRTARDGSVADELLQTVQSEGADLLVSGVYGHDRVREWILGGVSRDLLDHSPVCCLMAH